MKILKFGADWCAPCKDLERKMKNCKHKDIVTCYNIDEDEDLADSLNINNIPTIIIIDDEGKERYRLVGNVPLEDVEKVMEKLQNE